MAAKGGGKEAPKASGKSGTEGAISELRSGIQASIDQRKRDEIRDMFKKRIEIVKKGYIQYKGRKFKNAAEFFAAYIRIVEDWKGVRPGGLEPKHFDAKAEMPEIVMMSAVYWDMIKAYDLTKDHPAELAQALNKYVVFCKGMPHESLCAESLRKYVAAGRAQHRTAFVKAYKKIRPEGCFVATALADQIQPETLPALRRFRDTALLPKWYGRAAVGIYYKTGPDLAFWIEKKPPWFKAWLARRLDDWARHW